MFHKLAADGARRRGKSSPEAKQSAATVGGGGVSGWVGRHDAASSPLNEDLHRGQHILMSLPNELQTTA